MIRSVFLNSRMTATFVSISAPKSWYCGYFSILLPRHWFPIYIEPVINIDPLGFLPLARMNSTCFVSRSCRVAGTRQSVEMVILKRLLGHGRSRGRSERHYLVPANPSARAPGWILLTSPAINLILAFSKVLPL